MSGELHPRPNLDYLKRKAKHFLKQHAEGNRDAIMWSGKLLPRLEGKSEDEIRDAKLTLADAQLIIARSSGFPSWPKLKHYIESIDSDTDATVFAFLEAAVPRVIDDHRDGHAERADAILAKSPGVADANVYAAAAAGNPAALRRLVDADASLVVTPGGPRNWEPLLYVCFSRLLRFHSEREDDFVNCASLLLERGADPNVHFMSGDERETALYGAAGVVNNATLMRVLIDAGAVVDDGEVYYHSAEFANNAVFDVIFEHNPGARARSTMLLRKLDFDDIDGVRHLLELGCDPNEQGPWGRAALHQAILRGRGIEFIDLLIEYGADINAKGEDWHRPKRSPLCIAARRGRRDVVERLRERGAEDDLTLHDRFIAACACGEDDDVARILRDNPGLVESLDGEDRQAIVVVASEGRTDAVRMMLDAGFDVAQLDNAEASSLHWACWMGYADTIELLVDRGAPLEINDRDHERTPMGWLTYGSTHNKWTNGDFARGAKARVKAGAKVDRFDMRDASDAVREIIGPRYQELHGKPWQS